MERNYKEINQKLIEAQRIWFEKILKSWMHEKKMFNRLKSWIIRKLDSAQIYSISYSEPFCMSVREKTDSNKPLIMIVGQEPNGYSYIKEFESENIEDSFSDSHKYAQLFTEVNISNDEKKIIEITNSKKKTIEIKRNPRQFWDFIRALNKKYEVCWNNLDKIHYRTDQTPCITLYDTDEIYLNTKFEFDGVERSLLLHEINIVNPDLIIFVIGPSYAVSLNSALNPDFEGDGSLIYEFDTKNKINQFYINANGNNIPALWTYHPAALPEYFRVCDIIVKVDEILL